MNWYEIGRQHAQRACESSEDDNVTEALFEIFWKERENPFSNIVEPPTTYDEDQYIMGVLSYIKQANRIIFL